ncbi:MAG: hypothetical protein JNM93_02890 [Bacteriovoracaceae bacterium]|nr:hypothetical protein [Bacteriovoracaceae bacterium]
MKLLLMNWQNELTRTQEELTDKWRFLQSLKEELKLENWIQFVSDYFFQIEFENKGLNKLISKDLEE